MAGRERKASSMGLYHITKRGICKIDIFRDDSDRICLLEYLESVISDKFKVHCYCLMDNHIHLLAEASSKEDLSSAMQLLFSQYVKYFNKKYDRNGTLFQKKFWSEPVESWRYFKSLVRYILRNPIDIGNTDLVQYSWSSIKYYYSDKKGLVSTKLINKIFEDKSSLLAFIKRENDIFSEIRIQSDNTEKKPIIDPGYSARKTIINFIQRKYNIHNPHKLPKEKKQEIIIGIINVMPNIHTVRLAECLKLNRKTVAKIRNKLIAPRGL